MSPFAQSWYAVLPLLPILLVHLGGIVVAIILLIRRRSTPAILALIGFGLLLVTAFANLFRGPLISQLAAQGGYRQIGLLVSGIGCCCSVFDVIAFLCLIVAIWQAVTSAGTVPPDEMTVDVEPTPPEPAPQVSPDSPEILEGIIETPDEANWADRADEVDEADEADESDEASGGPTEMLGEAVVAPPVTEEAPPSPYATRVLDETLQEASDVLDEKIETPFATRVLNDTTDDETADVTPDSE